MQDMFAPRHIPLLLFLFIFGCSTSPETVKKETASTPSAAAPHKPELTLTVGSLNLSGLAKRIEKKDIENFAKLIMREQIEILAVQGIARYPGIATRVDFVNVLSNAAEMRNAFGETINLSGRQNGNAVFSSFPIRMNQNTPFHHLKSTNFESALFIAVDAGVKDLVVISTLLPEKASAEDLMSCVQAITDLKKIMPASPYVVAGNLPQSPRLRSPGGFRDIDELGVGGKGKNGTSKIWFTGDGLFEFLSARSVETELGVVNMATFGLFTKPRP